MPETRQPLFSIITPTFKRPELLKRAVNSVRAQTLCDYEHIIVDDAGDPATKDFIAGLADNRVCFHQHKLRRGAAGAYNTGILAAKGKFILFLDDDDEYLPELLEKLKLLFSELNQEIGFVWTGIRMVRDSDSGEKVLYSKVWPSVFTDSESGLVEATTIGNGYGLCVRKECVDSVGLYDESFTMGHDADFLIRLAMKYRFRTIPEVLVNIHVHGISQLTGKQNNAERLEIRERILERHKEFLLLHPRLFIAHHKLIAELAYGLNKKQKGRSTMKELYKISPFNPLLMLDFLMYELTGKNCSSVYRSETLKSFRSFFRFRSKYLIE